MPTDTTRLPPGRSIQPKLRTNIGADQGVQPDSTITPTPKKRIEAAYRITLPWIVLYFAVFIIIVTVFLTRSNAFWNTVPLIGTLHIGQHASNFAISYFIVVASGLQGLIVSGPKAMRHVYAIAGVLTFANIICELFIPLLNTRDIVDMIYGILGTACATGILWLIQRFGLRHI